MELLTTIFITVLSWIPTLFGIALLCLAVYVAIEGIAQFINAIRDGLFVWLADIPMLIAKLVFAFIMVVVGLEFIIF